MHASQFHCSHTVEHVTQALKMLNMWETDKQQICVILKEGIIVRKMKKAMDDMGLLELHVLLLV